MDKLSDRRILHKLQLFYKMDNHLTPEYLSNLLPPHIGEVSSYRTHFVTQIIILKFIQGLHFIMAINPSPSLPIPVGLNFCLLILKAKFRNWTMLFDGTLIELFDIDIGFKRIFYLTD